MVVWRLIPLDLNDPNWTANSHRGPAIVRAPDERRARKAAERAFGIKTRFEPGAAVRAAPWTRASLTRAEEIDDPLFAPDGPIEVLEPSFD